MGISSFLQKNGGDLAGVASDLLGLGGTAHTLHSGLSDVAQTFSGSSSGLSTEVGLARQILGSNGEEVTMPGSPIGRYGGGAASTLGGLGGTLNGIQALVNNHGDAGEIIDGALGTANGLATTVSGVSTLADRGGLAQGAGVVAGALEAGQGVNNIARGWDQGSTDEQGRPILPSDDLAAQGVYQLLHGGASAVGSRGGATPLGVVGQGLALGLDLGNQLVSWAERESSEHGGFGRDANGNNIDSSTAASNSGMEYDISQGATGPTVGGAATTIVNAWGNTADVASSELADAVPHSDWLDQVIYDLF